MKISHESTSVGIIDVDDIFDESLKECARRRDRSIPPERGYLNTDLFVRKQAEREL